MAPRPALCYESGWGERRDELARGVWLALLAVTLSLTPDVASSGPVAPESGRARSTWEEYGSGQTNGLAVGAYPLPSQPDRRDGEAEQDGDAKERWLRRHYQWLRALNEMLGAPGDRKERRADDGQAREPARPAAAAPPPAGTMRLGEMIVLFPEGGREDVAPHLLDNGARDEDPEIGLASGEVLQYMVSERLSIESAQVVAEFFGELRRTLRTSFGPLAEAPRSGEPRFDNFQMEPQFAAVPTVNDRPGAPRSMPASEPVTMIAFFKGIILDILSAPTTYLLTLIALIGWVILRATVFSRS